MGRYLNEARQRLEEIRRLHEHAGMAGYSQAVSYYNELSNIYGRAANSKSGRNDAIAICELVKNADTLMEEMKSRRGNAPQEPGQGDT